MLHSLFETFQLYDLLLEGPQTLGKHIQNEKAPHHKVEMAADDTAYTFDFTGVSCFNSGDIIAVSVTPEVAVYDLVWTLVLEYYIAIWY